MRKVASVALAATMLWVLHGTAGAGAHAKATGEITLTGNAFGDRHAIFDAHDAAPAGKGTTEDRGEIFFEITSGPNSGSQFWADVDCVVVEGARAYFRGVVRDDATGFYAQFRNDPVYAHVYDGGTPGADGDTWRADFNGGNRPCGAPTGGNPVSGGNLKVHS